MTTTTVNRPTTTPIRERFGGVDTPAALMGMFAALGVLVLAGAAITTWATGLDYQLNMIDLEGNVREFAVAGTVVAVLVVFVAFLLGGWAAGRMARYDGGINGIAAAMWMLLLVAVFAALGAFVDAELNVMQRAGLPDWFSQLRGDDVATGAIIAAVAAVVAMFVGAYAGGKLGEGYHREVDAEVAARADR